MKLVIDINEELYEQAIRDKDYHDVTGLNDIDEYSLPIANGTLVSTEGDLISRSNLKNEVQRISRTYTEMSATELGHDILRAIDNASAVGPIYVSDLERKVIVDSINYLLGAELLEENGYTEEVVNALKSVLQKIGAEENHL